LKRQVVHKQSKRDALSPNEKLKEIIYFYLMRQYNFYTYMLTNYSKTVPYTGVTNDLDRRLYEHYFGLDQKNSYTSKYKCYYLLWYERYQYVNHAIEREKEIKGCVRIKKNKLIEEENPDWRFLNKDIMEWPPVRTH
jgi:putative endonuclease